MQEVVLKGRRRRPVDPAGNQGLAGGRRRLPEPRTHPHQAPGDRARATSGCIACSSTTTGRSACTGRSTRTRPRMPRLPSAAASGCRSRSPSAARRRSPTRRPRRCRATSTSTCSPDSCNATGSRWSSAYRCRSRCPPRRRWSSKAGSNRARGTRKGPFGDHTGFYTPVEPFPFMHVDVHDHAVGRDLPDDRRRPAAAGGRPDREGHRAHLPAADPADHSGDRRLRPARGGRVPQLRRSSRSTSGSPSTRRR